MSDILYTPSTQKIAQSQMMAFAQKFGMLIGKDVLDYVALHRASLDYKAEFWKLLRDECGIIGDLGDIALIKGDNICHDVYFPNDRLNYAENLLGAFADDSAQMLVFSSEGQNNKSFTAGEVKKSVTAFATFLKAHHIMQGDRIAAIMPNMAETIIAMLGMTSLGGVFASCSPDFGVDAIIDRFGQIAPKMLIITDSYRYNGKIISMQDKIAELIQKMPDIEKIIIVPFFEEKHHQMSHEKIIYYPEILENYKGKELHFTRMPFSAPLFIMFSSGTTGIPKCIVHSIGGTLLQHLKEHRLHCDLRKGDRFFYYTTCGWMMWNWSVSSLASGMTLLLYDGSPFAPDEKIIFEYISTQKASLLGVSAKFIDAVRKSGFIPAQHYDFDSLKIITSTGSPLSAEGFDFVYESIKQDVHLASISGGTDIVSCFVLGVPILPVYSGEIQGAGLGMDIDIYDDNGLPLEAGKGELVCKSSFPCMPIGFWNDETGEKYHHAYFDRFENIWAHGDFAEKTPAGGIIIHGRSDAVLNPGGVRIGTAEIYRQVEKFDEILESVCIGQHYEDDIRVVLFIKLREGIECSETLLERIKREIRTHTSPRHVPAIIKPVTDIPRTKSGKITEIAVRDIIHGKEIKNIGSLANPEALEYYKNILAS